MLEFKVGNFVASGVVVENTVKSYGLFGYYRGAELEFGLQGSRCAYAHHSEASQVVANLASVEVDVGESVELVDYYVDVVRAYAVGQAHDGLASVCAAYGVEFA